MNEQTETNQVAVETKTPGKPGKPRTRFTKTFKVVKTNDGWTLANRGKPSSGAVMGEVTLPFDHNRANGVPSNATVTNEHTVVYQKKEKVVAEQVAPAPAV